MVVDWPTALKVMLDGETESGPTTTGAATVSGLPRPLTGLICVPLVLTGAGVGVDAEDPPDGVELPEGAWVGGTAFTEDPPPPPPPPHDASIAPMSTAERLKSRRLYVREIISWFRPWNSANIMPWMPLTGVGKPASRSETPVANFPIGRIDP